MTGVSPTPIMWSCRRRILTLLPMNLDDETDSNSLHVMIIALAN